MIKFNLYLAFLGVQAFPDNQFATALLETLKHSQALEEKNKEREKETLCVDHGKPLELYCYEVSCQQVLCAICMTREKHKGHSVWKLKDNIDYRLDHVTRLKGDFQNITDAWKNQREKVLRDVFKERDRKQMAALNMIDEKKKELFKEIEKIAGEMKKKVVESYNTATEQVKAHVESIHNYEIKSKEFVREGQVILDNGNPYEIVKYSKEYALNFLKIVEEDTYEFPTEIEVTKVNKSDFSFGGKTEETNIIGCVEKDLLVLPKVTQPKLMMPGVPTFKQLNTWDLEPWSEATDRKMCVVGKYVVLAWPGKFCTYLRVYLAGPTGTDILSVEYKKAWKTAEPIELWISEVVLYGNSYLAISFSHTCKVSIAEIKPLKSETVGESRLQSMNGTPSGTHTHQLCVLGSYIAEGFSPGIVTHDYKNNILVVNRKVTPAELHTLCVDENFTISDAENKIAIGLPYVSAMYCKKNFDDRRVLYVSCMETNSAIGINVDSGQTVWNKEGRFSSFCSDKRDLLYAADLGDGKKQYTQQLRSFYAEGRYEHFSSDLFMPRIFDMGIMDDSLLILHIEDEKSKGKIQASGIEILM